MGVEIRNLPTNANPPVMADLIPLDPASFTITSKNTIQDILSTGAGNSNSGTDSRVEGQNSKSAGVASHAEGFGTQSLADYAHAEGVNTVASGVGSHAAGNTTVASGASATATGNNTLASGISSTAAGTTTTASGNYAVATGTNTFAIGIASKADGFFSQAQGNYSHAENSGSTLITAPLSYCGGLNGVASQYNEWVRGAGNNLQQYGIISYAMQTADSVATEAFLDGTAIRFTIATDHAYKVKISVMAKSSPSGVGIAGFTGKGLIKNDSTTVSLLNAITMTQDEFDGTFTSTAVTVTADNTNKSLKVMVTGVAATIINWIIRVDYEMLYV